MGNPLHLNSRLVEAGAKAAYESSMMRQFNCVWPTWSRMDEQLKADLISDFRDGLAAAEKASDNGAVVYVEFGQVAAKAGSLTA